MIERRPDGKRVQPKGGSRKGIPNKTTRDIKEMILGALHDEGGQAWLRKQMNANPTAFMGLLGKILPTTISATIKREVTEYTADELRAIIAASSHGIARQADGATEVSKLH